MSISGIFAAPAASYIPQLPGTTPATTPSTTFGAAAQIASTTPAVPVQQAAPAQPSAPAHHHHHHTSGQSFDVTQSGTNAVGNILSTLV